MKQIKKLKKQIIRSTHLKKSDDLVREYFYESELSIEMIEKEDLEKLSILIQKYIDFYLVDETYSMIKRLKIKSKIQINKEEMKLRVSGYYFNDREAITFIKSKDRNKRIYFCRELCGCNHTPFILGFIDWCDWMKIKLNPELVE
jgi:hypothetical protein